MRTHLALAVIALSALCACAHAHKGPDHDAAPLMSPGPLKSCGIAEVQIDGTDAILTANIDATLDTETIVSAPDDRARADARRDLRAIYGDPKPDGRMTYRPWHYGLMQPVDLCGRPTNPSPVPAPSPSP
ncbi:MAG TPA: hypothetical protein VMS32_06405 [Verrucomicrobiae bacterium]|jgi:hypothetical protein|nr:hypothetical protein [Verrucomicrobiae bacterium]